MRLTCVNFNRVLFVKTKFAKTYSGSYVYLEDVDLLYNRMFKVKLITVDNKYGMNVYDTRYYPNGHYSYISKNNGEDIVNILNIHAVPRTILTKLKLRE